MSYLAYHFHVQPPEPGTEILIACLSDFGFESFETNENGFVAYVNRENLTDFDPDQFGLEGFTFTYKVEEIQTRNWNAEWEKNFEPVHVDRLLCIRAPFHPHESGFEQEIVIMPKMSFGTGHHQTTRLVCRGMFEQNFEGKSVLDMGCGTGILAILAAKLGAKEITAIDIDTWCVENSQENCLANNCSTIKVLKGDSSVLASQGKFDHILANINKNILKKDLAIYVEHLKTDGYLYLSGFFVYAHFFTRAKSRLPPPSTM